MVGEGFPKVDFVDDSKIIAVDPPLSKVAVNPNETLATAETLVEAEAGLKKAKKKWWSKKKDEPKEPLTPSAPYWQLYSYADGTDKVLIFVGSVCAAANGAVLPLFTLVFGKIINTIGKGEEISGPDFQSEINKVCLYFVYLAIAAGVVSYFEVAFWMLAGSRQARRIKENYLKAVLRQDVSFFDTMANSGELTSGINEDTVAVQNAIGEKVGNFIHNLGTFVAGIILAFAKGWSMTLVMIALVPVMAVLGIFFGTMIGNLQEKMTTAYASANALAQESLANMRTVCAFNAQQRTADRYAEDLIIPEKVQIRGGVFQGLILGAFNSFFMFSYALALWYGSTRILNGEYDGGEVLNVLFAALIGGFALGQAAPNIQSFVTGTTAFARLQKVLKRKPEIDEEDAGERLKSVDGTVELRNVEFKYPARAEVTVLQNFSLIIPAGTSMALCGQSGSGKSTIVQLVERFYDPTSGQVLLDGQDIRTFDLAWYRSHVGLVSQEPTLFASDILSNIAYGRPGATQAEIEEAARTANAHGFISALPMGYSTPVGDKGVQLSGGQKQRIAIARAILKNPKVLLCDEATSALDNKSERLVQLALERLSQGRTTIVVAHRLSTIIHSNQIAVVREGKIVEQGTHAELISRPEGAYSVLVGLQMSALGIKKKGAEVEDDEDVDDVDIVVKGPTSSKSFKLKAATADGMAVDEEIEKRVWWKRCLPSKNIDEEEKKPTEPKVKAGFFRLAKYNATEWPAFVFGVIGSAVLGLVMPGFALALSSITSAFFSPSRSYLKQQVAIWCGVFAGVGLAALLAGILQGFCFTLMGAKLTRRIRVALMMCLMRQEMAFFDKSENTSGALVARLGVDSTSIRGAVGDQVGVLAQNLVTFVVAYIIAFISGWKMTLVITAVLPLLMFAAYMEALFMEGFSNEASALYNKANQMAADAFGACRTVAAFNLRGEIFRLYCNLLDLPEKKLGHRAQASGVGYAMSQFIMMSVYALGFWYGGRLIIADEMSFEDMLKVFFAILLAAMGISQARMTFPDLSKASGAVQRVFSVLDRPSAINAFDPSGDRLEKVDGRIELCSLQFAYPERPEVTVFHNFDLQVDAGKTVALCGQSGSGKSSIVALILRFYDPLSGSVLLDGFDIRNLNLRWLREQMSLVGQEPHLFTGTIEDNIRYGKADATDGDVREAAAAANALDFIEAAPAAFNTLVGEGGIQLSGGQRQRIAIARSIIRQPKVLLLDEATSALDATSERIVQEALDRLSKNRTTVVVAHRLSTIRNADSIAVLQEGKILEQGRHEELMEMPRGAYRALITQQQQST